MAIANDREKLYASLTKSEIKYAYNYLLYLNKYPGTMCLTWYDIAVSVHKMHEKFPGASDFAFLYPDASLWFTPEKGKEIFKPRKNFDETIMQDIIKEMDEFKAYSEECNKRWEERQKSLNKI